MGFWSVHINFGFEKTRNMGESVGTRDFKKSEMLECPYKLEI
jgi:hypothetical protein